MTLIDSDGMRHSLDVLADSSYDACHVFMTHAKNERRSGLPIPTADTVFEVTAKGGFCGTFGRVADNRWMRKRQQRRNPFFSKRRFSDGLIILCVR